MLIAFGSKWPIVHDSLDGSEQFAVNHRATVPTQSIISLCNLSKGGSYIKASKPVHAINELAVKMDCVASGIGDQRKKIFVL